MLTPTTEQQEAIDRIVSEPTKAALLASSVGTGKTVIAVEVARALGAQTILLIAPLNTKSGWSKTFAGQGVTLPFREITTKDAHNYDALLRKEPGIYLVGREMFARSGTATDSRTVKWSWARVRPDIAVYDESQQIQNRHSQGFKVLKTLNPGFRLAMSATPAGNKFAGIWSVCRWLWPHDRNPKGDLYVDNSQWRWAATWAIVEDDRFTGKRIAGERNPGAFVASLPCYIRQEADRVPVTEYRVAVTLSDKQRRMYDQMERQALAWLGENPLVAELPVVQRIRLRQITLGEVSFAEDGSIDFEDDCASSKAEACVKIIDRHPGESILFWTDSQRFARVLAKRLPGAVEWSGAVSKAERERILQGFGSEFEHIVATIAGVGPGVDGLQKNCHIEVWCSEQEGNHTAMEQAEGRLNRRGQPADEIIQYRLIALGTYDEGINSNLVKQTIAMRGSLKA